MKQFLKIIATVALVTTLGACAQFQAFQQRVENAYTSLSGAQISYQDVAAGIAAFQTLQKVGEAYLKQPTCTAISGPICHDRRATRLLNAAFLTGRRARNDVIAYMDAHPCANKVCPLMPDGVYAGLQSAIDELQGLYSTYKVHSGAQ